MPVNKEELEKVASGEKTFKLPARWTQDCNGKQDYDYDIITLGTRYYPDHTSYVSILIGDAIFYFVRGEFEDCKTEGEAKHKAEQWAQGMFDRVVRAVASELLREPLEPPPEKNRKK